jgi:hypothetical protein
MRSYHHCESIGWRGEAVKEGHSATAEADRLLWGYQKGRGAFPNSENERRMERATARSRE